MTDQERKSRAEQEERNQPHAIDEDQEVLNDEEVVDEASEDSFPASDPPGWATGNKRDGEEVEPES